ncbi:MAG TPA: hypothetical protein VIA98_05800 [Allosphingosinicella sp.]
MLENLARSSGAPIAPRAIFSRSIEYFSARIHVFVDDFDACKAAYFSSGNHIYFELRKYASHPDTSTTLYLSLALEEDKIISTVKTVVDALDLPWSAVVWYWSEDLASIRPLLEDHSRLREREARELVLKVAAKSPDRTATMEEIRSGVSSFYPLSKADRVRSLTRPAEQLWQQILRNVVSHRGGANSIFVRGLAEKLGNGIRITSDGLRHLKRSGFIP